MVSDDDPAWPEGFDTVHRHVWPTVEDVAVRIDHVGLMAVVASSSRASGPPLALIDVSLAAPLCSPRSWLATALADGGTGG